MNKTFSNDVNRGYLDFISSLSILGINGSGKVVGKIKGLIRHIIELILIPFLILYGIVLVIILKAALVLSNKRRSELHLEATKYIGEFVDQYPMHLYPIVSKCIELAFIKRELPKILAPVRGGVVEFAIGEGSFSKRIFSDEDRITALELNPYSLQYVANCKHVNKRIIADCLKPPIVKSGASVIVCNNLLHHITNKSEVLENWANIAKYALFNENTDYWSSSWAKPYILKRLGLEDMASKAAKRMETDGYQTLYKSSELNKLISKFYNVKSEYSFFNEKVFFLCALFSSLMLCFGPPTPRLPKLIFNKVLWPITKPLTYALAKNLIVYDSIYNRDRDSFVIWTVESKLIKDDILTDRVILNCPDCNIALFNNYCNQCNTTFEEINGMLFLLPKELMKDINYVPDIDALTSEHL